MQRFVYDDFRKAGGYTLADYDAKWSVQIPGEMAIADTAFPFQHPDAPAQSVSVPMQERLFGQGVRATFANVVVTIEDNGGSRP